MRAKLQNAWPSLAMHFGLYPDDVPRFSAAEWAKYLDALRELDRQAKEARARAR